MMGLGFLALDIAWCFLAWGGRWPLAVGRWVMYWIWITTLLVSAG
jgi:hypothetical protein